MTALGFRPVREHFSPCTALPTWRGSSPTTVPVIALPISPPSAVPVNISGSLRTRRVITGKWSATTGSSAKNCSTPVSGSARPSDPTRSKCGIFHYNYLRPHTAASDQPPASILPVGDSDEFMFETPVLTVHRGTVRHARCLGKPVTESTSTAAAGAKNGNQRPPSSTRNQVWRLHLGSNTQPDCRAAGHASRRSPVPQGRRFGSAE